MRIIFLSAICLVSAHGLFRDAVLDGHDSEAYGVTQHQFHLNIAEAVIFPRWAPDMRYGYGHPKLQFRPPVLHYFTEFFYLFTGDMILGLNLALVLMVFTAGFGMYFFAATSMSKNYALIAAAAYVTANYYLSDIYLRGAYYEVTAYAYMPWILWACNRIFHGNSLGQAGIFFRSVLPFFTGSVAWALLLCGHPQIAAFFIPVGLAYIIYLYCMGKDRKSLSFSVLTFVCGLLLSAPYVYVAIRETQYVRMQLFLVNLESYYRHFISLKTLLYESWPSEYLRYTGELDYLNRPIHCEMRGLNLWALAVLLLVPFLWFRRKTDGDKEFYPLSMFFYFWIIATIAVTLPLSHGFWDLIPFIHTFNFPWRALAVTSLCIAVLSGLTAERIVERYRIGTGAKTAALAAVLVAMEIPAFMHSGGWNQDKWINGQELSRELIVATSGIPQEFYTPKWVRNYATAPADKTFSVEQGSADVKILRKGASRWNIAIDAYTDAKITFAHYYYPGWTLYLNRKNAIPAKPDDNGLMSFSVPKGDYRAEIRFSMTGDRIAGYVFFVFGLLVMLSASFFLVERKNE